MSLTALDLTQEDYKEYRTLEIVRARRKARLAELTRRRRRARYTARKAAELLRSEFGAVNVILFGSLATSRSFTRWSDIDLAASEIPPGRFYEAAGKVLELSNEFKIDLVDMDGCPPSLLKAILEEGIPL